MPKTTEKQSKKIEKAYILACGREVYAGGRLGVNLNNRGNNSNVLVIKHANYGYILYNTGYNPSCDGKKFLCGLSKVEVADKDRLIRQLSLLGVPSGDINYVMLSHIGLDTIGGLQDVVSEGTKLIMNGTTAEAYGSILSERRNPCRQFLPTNVEILMGNNILEGIPGDLIVKDENVKWLHRYFYGTYDILGDGSLIAVTLDGRYPWTMCLYIPELDLFIAPGFCTELKTTIVPEELNLGSRLVLGDYKEYIRSCRLISRFVEKEDVTLVVQSDSINDGWELTGEGKRLNFE